MTAALWTAYTDGACKKNPGPGGWGVRMTAPNGDVQEAFGGERLTTNNRMEMMALLKALEMTPAGAHVLLHSDSEYSIKANTDWRPGWERRGLKKADGKPIANPDLVRQLWAAVDQRRVQFKWVRGHAGDPGNERADELANLGVPK